LLAVAAGFLAVPAVFCAASAGFLVEGDGSDWMGFLEPIADRAGFAADPAVSLGAEAAPPAVLGAAFFTGVLLGVDFAAPSAPEAAFAGVAFAGVDVPLFAGVLPAALFPSFWGAFLGAALTSLSTILIFDMLSVIIGQLLLCVRFTRLRRPSNLGASVPLLQVL
jgi:hypothetical protein